MYAITAIIIIPKTRSVLTILLIIIIIKNIIYIYIKKEDINIIYQFVVGNNK